MRNRTGPDSIVVAVDGPSGSGKSSVSKAVADRLRLGYLDTGAMYRAAAWEVLSKGIDLADEGGVAAAVAGMDLEVSVDPLSPRATVDGVDVTQAIRSPEVTAAVSAVSAVPAVRARMVALQRETVDAVNADMGGIIVEGRDIGTTVLPTAKLKVFLTADVVARAERRHLEDAMVGRGAGTDATRQALAARDEADSGRATSPLEQAADAVVVDATALSLAEVIEAVTNLIEQRFPSAERVGL